jgi:penicillin-binding protein 1C
MTPDLSGVRRRTRTFWFLLWALWWGCCADFLAVAWSLARLETVTATPLLEDRAGGYLAEANKDSGDLGFWEVDPVPNRKIVEAVIAAEDVRFRWFPGVDPIALARSLVAPWLSGRSEGGSTIAMQVARLQSSHSRTLENKMLETATAVFLTLRYGHDQVLNQYLKLVPQGNRIFGVAYGARRYFHKPLEDVSWAEAALLASLPQAPGKMNLFDGVGFSRASARAQRILASLRASGRITGAEADFAVRELAVMPLPESETRPGDTYHFVLRALAEDKAHGVLTVSKPRLTTLDPRIQKLTQDTVQQLYEDHAAYNVGNVAALVVSRSGEVLAYVGSFSYFSTPGAGAIDYVQVHRSSGSTLKPLLYALALDEHKASPATVLADLPFSVLDPKGVYHPANFDDEYLGPMLFRRALANSRNIPALRVLESLGLGEAYSRLSQWGLIHDDRGADWYGYGLAIGGLYVSLEDLVRSYGTLANDGKAFGLKFFRDPEPEDTHAVISPYAARTVSLALSDETARAPSFPRGSALDYPWPVAIKTGTSQGYRDAWAIAYDSKYVVGVWMGDAENAPMNRVAGVVAAQGIHRLLAGLEPQQAQGIDTVPFPKPENTVAVDICSLSGEVAGPDCTSTSVEYFPASEAPRTVCEVHVRRPVDVRTGQPPTGSTRAEDVVMRPFTILPVEYTLWSLQHGLGVPGSGRNGRFFRLTSPINGAKIYRDPETPPAFQTLALQAAAVPGPPHMDWYVDGQLFESVPPPYTARWPLISGIHRFEARWPGSDVQGSATVEVR